MTRNICTHAHNWRYSMHREETCRVFGAKFYYLIAYFTDWNQDCNVHLSMTNTKICALAATR